MLDSFVDPEDERRIHRLYALYCHFFAHGEPEEWVSIFTPDGVFAKLSASQGGLGTSAQTVEGHAALLEMTKGRREMFQGQVRHQQTDIVILPGADADSAVGHSLILVTDWRSGQGRLAALGSCKSEFKRIAAGWRFQRIELTALPKPNAQAGTAERTAQA
ncbi:nuclear transport factor 2 family protein [Pseudooceanicola sp.]|uniref:nuclear transport factor 2 family protein n=1 Tax=Pseudooceanicola sp. TaxID=1914328 RepID=UPI003513C3CE